MMRLMYNNSVEWDPLIRGIQEKKVGYFFGPGRVPTVSSIFTSKPMQVRRSAWDNFLVPQNSA